MKELHVLKAHLKKKKKNIERFRELSTNTSEILFEFFKFLYIVSSNCLKNCYHLELSFRGINRGNNLYSEGNSKVKSISLICFCYPNISHFSDFIFLDFFVD
jgi:hypothetical protein